ncbi:diguanylate cyclase (GGDEF)-like protein [Paraburkholderia caballeronis]|uniref:GGDEF domain-containing protein n=1 Tax=Paraburkholderia caballeronis TaxID=416943 RepID=UPI001065441C|nr:GGDEF domain-containing protein [Paraburkholderia caballeronis]TDV39436.1 diguanylate cyclase (GGDEF)-like protein [Paraburkholderia caballeronis]
MRANAPVAEPRHPPPATPVNPRFSAAAILIGCLFLVLTAALVWYEWDAYADANDAVASFGTFRATLVAMEKVSAERGPMNAALGSDDALPDGAPAPLAAARRDTDAAIARLRTRLDTPSCGWCESERLGLARLVNDLTSARSDVDRLLKLPGPARTDAALNDAVARMVAVVRQFRRIIDASQLAIVDSTTGALDFLQMARLAATMRDEAGLLGSRFTSALATHRPLTQAEQLNVERSYGRMQQLRFAIESLAATNPALTRGAFVQVNEQYFRLGLDYIATVRALTGGPGSPLPTTAQFAATYVPTMRPIVDFRDEMLARAEAALLRHRSAMLARCVAIAVAGVVLASLQFALFWLFRRYVIAPFNDATRAIVAIAGGDLTAAVQSHAYRGDVQSLFDAVQVLRSNSRERMRLEQERNALIDELKTMAETDALTGLMNRRAFEGRARVLSSIARGTESFVTLIAFDIDHFKRINDTYGHPTGDLALKTIGNLCRETWRRDDIVARIGGEEFAVLLDTQGYAEALQTVERFREKLSNVTLRATDGTPFTMTASFGVAVSARDAAPDIAALIARADALLYRAKTDGRNRVVADEPAAT